VEVGHVAGPSIPKVFAGLAAIGIAVAIVFALLS
jgi:hypothetical protein